jgi:hypothetical protein
VLIHVFKHVASELSGGGAPRSIGHGWKDPAICPLLD